MVVPSKRLTAPRAVLLLKEYKNVSTPKYWESEVVWKSIMPELIIFVPANPLTVELLRGEG